ncbi:MAG: hypothetical protein M1549_00310 [Candidatus Dependentiae bacterium]|nr:hypothetical protein [Candidatus Dependentiae bacterium]
MNRKDIQSLRIHCGYPAITIVMPCDKKGVQSALMQIVDQLTEATIAQMIREKSAELLKHFSCQLPGTKTAIFIDKHRAQSFIVPDTVPDTIACGTTFKLDAIQSALNHAFRYWVINCIEQEPRLDEGMGSLVYELAGTCTGFHDAECELKHNKGRCFDICFNDYLEQDPLPIAIVGTAQQTLRLRLLAPYADRIVARTDQMADIWPAMQRWHAAEVERMLKKIAAGFPDQSYIIDLHEILTYARQGSVGELVVEEGYARPGCEHPTTRVVVFNRDCPVDYVAISAIEQIMEAVRSKGGTILFVPDGSLRDYNRMIAFLWHQ